MRVDDKQFYRAWLKALKPLDPLKLWTDFVVKNELPPLTFSFEAAAVYSSNIEGNSMDLRAFLESKAGRTSRHFKAKERREIEALIEAYRFARTHALNEKNLPQAHALLTRPLLPKVKQGRYRDQLMFVYSQYGIEYAAVEPDFVPEKMSELFAELKAIRQSAPDARSVFTSPRCCISSSFTFIRFRMATVARRACWKNGFWQSTWAGRHGRFHRSSITRNIWRSITAISKSG